MIGSVLLSMFVGFATPATAQTPPAQSEIAAYDGLHHAAHQGNVQVLSRLIAAGADTQARDRRGRTPEHVAAHASQEAAGGRSVHT